eukprot:TRINITY_DN5446_c0_g1_i2.p1 TRINITY_DN5446_c0_g1~~TRINITY_DN5446_c0_g1_i2.p1  ORF type:complete len:102 (-),score=29.58 TRINITY_DN5446_c0_g1_i2:58-363(-)
MQRDRDLESEFQHNDPANLAKEINSLKRQLANKEVEMKELKAKHEADLEGIYLRVKNLLEKKDQRIEELKRQIETITGGGEPDEEEEGSAGLLSNDDDNEV